MKKRMVKLLSFAVMLSLVFAMSVSVFATAGDYFDSPELWEYEEKETTIDGSVQAVVGTQVEGDGKGQNNYNIRAVLENVEGYSAQDLLGDVTEYGNAYQQQAKAEYQRQGFEAEFADFIVKTEFDVDEYYEYVNIQYKITLTDNAGNVNTMYQEIAVIPAETYVVYVTVTNVISAQACEEVFNEAIEYLWINDYNFLGEDFGEYTDDIMGLSIGIVIAIAVLVIVVPIAIVIIVVVLLIRKSSKKKKAMQAQQYNPYGYNPYGQPQQPYNPNAPQPPYGNNTSQQPYGQPQQPPMPSYMQPPVQPQPPVEAPTAVAENTENNSENLDN